jgi:RNA polymerase sigma-B factor
MSSLAHCTDMELVQEYRDNANESAREALVLRHARLVRAIAHRYSRRGLAYDDIVQSGYVGLIQAVDRFDASRGVPLERYAARTIEGEIMHLFRDRGWAVRVPRTLQDLSRRVAAANEQLGHKLGRTPTMEELAEFVDEPCDLVEEAVAAQRAYHAEPLSDSGGGDESPTGSNRRPQQVISEDGGFFEVENREQLAWAIQHLPPRERMIIHLRFFEDMTQSEIAERLRISQMHVSRLLRASLETLRETIETAAA